MKREWFVNLCNMPIAELRYVWAGECEPTQKVGAARNLSRGQMIADLVEKLGGVKLED